MARIMAAGTPVSSSTASGVNARAYSATLAKPTDVAFDEVLVVGARFHDLMDQPPGEGAVGAGAQVGVEVGAPGDRREARVDDHERRALAPRAP